MSKRNPVVTSFFVWTLLLLSPWCHAQGSGKKVTRQSDLPRFTYAVKGSASELVQADDATFNTFASRVRMDLDTVFRDYEIEDKSTLRSLLYARLDLQRRGTRFGETKAEPPSPGRRQHDMSRADRNATSNIV